MSRRTQQRKKQRIQARQRTPPPPADVWDVVFWMPTQNQVPAREWLLTVPRPVRLMMVAIVDSVRDGPPPSYLPSELWHAMQGPMSGVYEARDRHDGRLYRLFCLLDRLAPEHGLPRPALAVLVGGEKANATQMDGNVYRRVLAAKADYESSDPRKILPPPGIPRAVR